MRNLLVSVGFHFQIIIITFHPIPFHVTSPIPRGEWEEKEEQSAISEYLDEDYRELALMATKRTATVNAVK